MVIDENNIRKSMFKLVWPSVAEMSLMMVVGVISTIFVGRLSSEAVAAVGLVNTMVGFMQVIFAALSTGCTVLVARLIGEGDTRQAKDSVKQAIVLSIAISLLIALMGLVFSRSILNLFFSQAASPVVGLADQYFRITLYTFPFFILNIMISGILRGSGNTRTPMFIAYIVNVVNVTLNFILIFGLDLPFLQFKGLGIVGAALAAAISRGTGGLLSFLVLLRPNCDVHIELCEKFRLNFYLIRRIFKIGIPAAVEQIVMQGGFLLLQVLIAGMGTTAIAVYQIGMSINSICFVPVWGFGIAATTMVGQCLGAGKPDLAEKCGWDTMKFSLFISVGLGLIIFIFAGQLMAVYSTDAEVIRIGTTAVRIFCVSQPLMSVNLVFSNALRGAGDVIFTTISTLIGVWGFRVMLTFALNGLFGLGIYAVWIALCADYFARAVLYLIRYQRGRWKLLVV